MMRSTFTHGDRRHLVLAALSLVVGCDAATPRLVYNESPRLASNGKVGATLRRDVLDCWTLYMATDNGTMRAPTLAPANIRLDTTVARYAYNPAYRIVRRLDANGRVVLRDVEGFEALDSWAAEENSDRIVVGINNGLYGSSWVLDVPRSRPRVNPVRGRTQDFSDWVSPLPDPIRSAMAMQIDCVPADDSVIVK